MGGKLISYTAYAGLLPIYVNDTGERMATMFFVAYVADGQSSKGRRPITFLWNGGPGSNSAQVHIVGFGPKRVVTADTYPEYTNTQTRIADNPESWLGTSDLVFVDPVGTGFSRATSLAYRDTLYTSRGDAEAVAEMIRVFLTRFDRWQSPLFIAGESYGTTRAELVADDLEKRWTHLSGVVLLSGAFDVGQSVPESLDKALRIVKMTGIGHYHHKLPEQLQSLSEADAMARAEKWAREVSAPALAKAASLNDAERDAIISQVAYYSGRIRASRRCPI
jgi:carboxypeptidase C (cathepsin A)